MRAGCCLPWLYSRHGSRRERCTPRRAIDSTTSLQRRLLSEVQHPTVAGRQPQAIAHFPSQFGAVVVDERALLVPFIPLSLSVALPLYATQQCCECTCEDSYDTFACGGSTISGFNCLDPTCFDPVLVAEFPECTGSWAKIGDSWCDAQNNNPSCGYDGGDVSVGRPAVGGSFVLFFEPEHSSWNWVALATSCPVTLECMCHAVRRKCRRGSAILYWLIS